jgi:hypothetical protein
VSCVDEDMFTLDICLMIRSDGNDDVFGKLG